ncbi:hypothetical protein QYM36_017914 [Artemia franciscana]|uniref:ZZ-type domain-containing protein n=1 Tax=Artemia franciscana TaxID=6661 RepID=A0AA88HE31_ARTSF|nr:hypothetical protein QYM36_017914 [Artemia franciscana]
MEFLSTLIDKIRATSLALILHRQLAFSSLSVQEKGNPDVPFLSYPDVKMLIYDILSTVERDFLVSTDASVNVDVVCSMIFACFSSFKCGKVGRLAVITFLICLSGGKLPDRLNLLCYWTASVRASTEQKNISRNSLVLLFRYISNIVEFVNEGPAFGSAHVPLALSNCLKHTEKNAEGISCSALSDWLLKEPQQFIWISTLYRLQVSEHVSHGGQCSACGTAPIIGLRYECLRCMRYESCQICFWAGRVASNHKTQHPMQEHCRLASRKERTKTFLQKIKLKFAGKSNPYPRHLQFSASSDGSEPNDLPNRIGSSTSSPGADSDGGTETVTDFADEVASRTVITLSEETGRQIFSKRPNAVRELESILGHLESGSRQLEQDLVQHKNLDGLVTPLANRKHVKLLNEPVLETLADQKAQMMRLRNLLKFIRDANDVSQKENVSPVRSTAPMMQSTPLIPVNPQKNVFEKRFKHLQSIENMSPINPVRSDLSLKTPLNINKYVESSGDTCKRETFRTLLKTPYRTQSMRAVTSRWSTAIEQIEEEAELAIPSRNLNAESSRLAVRGLDDLSRHLGPSSPCEGERSLFSTFIKDKANKGIFKEPASEIFTELEEIMASVERMFPKENDYKAVSAKNPKETAVLNAAAEIEDILTDLVKVIKEEGH